MPSNDCAPDLGAPVRLYLEIERLDDELFPAHVTHALGMVMLAVDERASRFAVADWVAMNLTPDEQTALRAGYGCPPCGELIDDHWLEGTVDPTVPDSLALPWLRQRKAA